MQRNNLKSSKFYAENMFSIFKKIRPVSGRFRPKSAASNFLGQWYSYRGRFCDNLPTFQPAGNSALS
jgi:hypothetical protein